MLRLARPAPGLYVLRDVLLDDQLSRPSDAQQQLAALLDPLDSHPDLLRGCAAVAVLSRCGG